MSTFAVENQRFLSSICDNPDDDDLRIVYADWLEDQDQSDRAEFIRAQVTLAQIRQPSDEWRDLRDRSLQLLQDHGDEWAANVLGNGVLEVRFHRGCIVEVMARARTFILRGDEWTSSHPIHSLTLTDVGKQAKNIASCEYLSNVTHLRLCDGRLSNDDLVAISQSPNLPRLRSISLCGAKKRLGYLPTEVTTIDERGLTDLADSSFSTQLASIEVLSMHNLRDWSFRDHIAHGRWARKRGNRHDRLFSRIDHTDQSHIWESCEQNPPPEDSILSAIYSPLFVRNLLITDYDVAINEWPDLALLFQFGGYAYWGASPTVLVTNTRREQLLHPDYARELSQPWEVYRSGCQQRFNRKPPVRLGAGHATGDPHTRSGSERPGVVRRHAAPATPCRRIGGRTAICQDPFLHRRSN